MIKTWNISIKDIDDTIEYLTHFKKFRDLQSSEIIKLLNEEHMKKFESFSKKFGLLLN